MILNESRYPIAAVREKVRQHDGHYLDFVLGRHREEPPAELTALLDRSDPTRLISSCGNEQIEAFSDAACSMMARLYDTTVAPGNILAVPGGRTAMSFLASSLIRTDDSVVIFDPAYPAFHRVAQQLGAQVHTVSMDPDKNFAPNLDAIAQNGSQARLAALNYPNNPTGAIIDRQNLAKLAETLPPETIIFNDATYGPLTFAEEPWSLLAQNEILNGQHRLLELHSLAKFFSLGPLSVSFLAGDEHIIGHLREYSEFAWSDQSLLQFEVAMFCLSDGHHLAAMRDTFRTRMNCLHETLEKLGFEPFPAESGMYIVCRVPGSIGGRPVVNAGQAAEVLLSEHAVAVVPWEVQPHEYLRFSGQYSEEDLEGLVALAGEGRLVSR